MQLDGKQLKDVSVTGAKLVANTISSAKVDASILVAAGTNALTGDLSAGGFKFTNLAAPTNPNDAARLVDLTASLQGFTVKAAVRIIATSALPSSTFAIAGPDTITSTTNNAFPAIDGVTIGLNDFIAVAGQATGSNNGLYKLTQVGSGAAPWILTRRNDYDVAAEVHEGDLFLVSEGTANAGAQYAQTAIAPTLNTTSLVFAKLAAGTTFATPTNADAGAATAGSATTAIRSDAKIQVSTAAPSVTVKSEAAATAVGAATTLLRSDMQIQAATATSVDLSTALAQGTSTSLARADHTHRGPKPQKIDKNLTASVTTADNQQATAATVTTAPILGGYVGVDVNGIAQLVGDGTKVSVDCYFSGDSGATARAFTAIVSTDKLYWNGTIAGYQLAATDRIDLNYETF